jgi:hypothetical protein
MPRGFGLYWCMGKLFLLFRHCFAIASTAAIFFSLSTLSANAAIHGEGKPMALVYDGIGACVEDCALSAANSARAAGLQVKIVGPKVLTEASTPTQIQMLFRGVKVWIQPGGYSKQAYEAMTPTLRKAIVDFVREGGGYVGFCAGAFMTSDQIGTTGTPGLGIFPGKTAPYEVPTIRPDLVFSLEKVLWFGAQRTLYFEGGPFLYDLDSRVEVVATYQDSKVAAARTTFGKGRVFISGPHPEAPLWWSNVDGIRDPDGSDQSLAVHMIDWAAQLEKDNLLAGFKNN